MCGEDVRKMLLCLAQDFIQSSPLLLFLSGLLFSCLYSLFSLVPFFCHWMAWVERKKAQKTFVRIFSSPSEDELSLGFHSVLRVRTASLILLLLFVLVALSVFLFVF